MATLAPDIERINALGAAEIEARLSGPPEQAAAFVREAAGAGSAEAQAVFGQMLLDGHGVAANAREALRWFGAAARQGHRLAINMIGRCYELGWGMEPDAARAAAWYRAAALRGLDWGMYNYATSLTLGAGVPEDKKEALAWLEKAAAMGNPKAINFVGSFHEDGWVVARDLDKAASLYARAAEGGDFRAQFNHARMLIAGGDIEGAAEWLGRSAKGATPRFAGQAASWLRNSGREEVRALARLFDDSAGREGAQ
jgi:TPR repeat protein